MRYEVGVWFLLRKMKGQHGDGCEKKFGWGWKRWDG